MAGLGRFIEPEEVIGHIRALLGRSGQLATRRIVVTAGPTREPLDPVRYLTNHSSGKQGFAVAQAAVDAGAEVTLIAGPVNLPTPIGAHRIDVESAQQMRDAVIAHACEQQADVLIMTAAVADFRPAVASDQKIKKTGDSDMNLTLTQNPDILREVSQQPQHPCLTIGFAAESQDLFHNAQAKLARKKLDLIVANDITASDTGFAVDTNQVLFITAAGVEEFPLMGKDEVAAHLIEWVADHLPAQ
jgi:phosphopantothenoylcysteine decarboxylase/phosphopantothenate--cysteine ligase